MGPITPGPLVPQENDPVHGSEAGTPVGDGSVVTVQGDPAGVPIPVTGSFTPPANQDVTIIAPLPVPVEEQNLPLPVDVTFPSVQPISGTVAAYILNPTQLAVTAGWDGGGVAIPAGTYPVNVIVPGPGTISIWAVNADIAGTVAFNVRKNGVDMIGAGTDPFLTAQTFNDDPPTGWTTVTFAALDVLTLELVVVATSFTQITLILVY